MLYPCSYRIKLLPYYLLIGRDSLLTKINKGNLFYFLFYHRKIRSFHHQIPYILCFSSNSLLMSVLLKVASSMSRATLFRNCINLTIHHDPWTGVYARSCHDRSPPLVTIWTGRSSITKYFLPYLKRPCYCLPIGEWAGKKFIKCVYPFTILFFLKQETDNLS